MPNIYSKCQNAKKSSGMVLKGPQLKQIIKLITENIEYAL